MSGARGTAGASDEAMEALGGVLRADQVEGAAWLPACIGDAPRAAAGEGAGGGRGVRVFAESEAECVALVEWARRYGCALYPVSRGRNWGYGSSRPTRAGSVVLDLSRMDRVVEFDEGLGTATVEPGVTQGGLRAFLDERGGGYLVPVTGAGPGASIVGNALERGYGITPYSDHFGALTSLRAVLGDGSIYESALASAGADRADRAYKWGVGPYLDGLFSQGGGGIVTRATIALARAGHVVEAFVFSVDRESSLEPAVEAVGEVLWRVGANLGAVNLMNGRRVLSMTEPYPSHEVSRGEVISEARVEAMCRRHGVGPWVGIGVVYGERCVAKAVRGVIRRALGGRVRKLRFMTRGKVGRLARLAKAAPGARAAALGRKAAALERALVNFEGSPSEVALPLCYWKSGRRPAAGAAMDPAADGCGLIWYSPLVTAEPGVVRSYAEFVGSTCRAHGIEPLITLTSISPRCFDSTVPILFDRSDGEEVGRAHACYEALLQEGRARGFMPYRVPTAWMDRIVDPASGFWRTAAAVRRSIDPDGVVAPGRYAPDAASAAARSPGDRSVEPPVHAGA